MINIIMDTLVFGLQRMGGVSVVWYQYLNRMLNDKRVDLTLLDIPGEYINDDYKKLQTDSVKHEKEYAISLQMLRNTNPQYREPDRLSIFQSTYLRTCRGKNIRNVVMIHDITHQLYFHGIKKWLNTLQKKKSIANADGIIYVSENTKKDVETYFPSSKTIRSTVIYNDAASEYKRIKKFTIPEIYSEIDGKDFFIYVGDRFDYKNTKLLFDILKRVTSIHCVLVGGKEFSDEEIEYFSNEKDRVHRYTRVSNVDLNILYNAAYCMIYPSHYEGFGIPVLEAMRAGCPVIAFKNSSIPEVLGGSGLLFENDDIDSVIESIERLKDDSFREKIIEDQMTSSKRFSWDESYNKLVSFYKEILSI